MITIITIITTTITIYYYYNYYKLLLHYCDQPVDLGERYVWSNPKFGGQREYCTSKILNPMVEENTSLQKLALSRKNWARIGGEMSWKEYWLVVWNMNLIFHYFSIYWEFHHPNWLSLHHFSGWGRWLNHQPGMIRAINSGNSGFQVPLGPADVGWTRLS